MIRNWKHIGDECHRVCTNRVNRFSTHLEKEGRNDIHFYVLQGIQSRDRLRFAYIITYVKIIVSLGAGKVFTALYANNGFWQTEVADYENAETEIISYHVLYLFYRQLAPLTERFATFQLVVIMILLFSNRQHRLLVPLRHCSNIAKRLSVHGAPPICLYHDQWTHCTLEREKSSWDYENCWFSQACNTISLTWNGKSYNRQYTWPLDFNNNSNRTTIVRWLLYCLLSNRLRLSSNSIITHRQDGQVRVESATKADESRTDHIADLTEEKYLSFRVRRRP